MISRPFDPHWTTEKASLIAYLDDLCAKISRTETRGKRRKPEAQANFEAAIKAIVLDLYRAHLSDPSLHVGIGLRQNTLQALSKSQYGSTIYTPTSFKQAMNGLLSGGYIAQTLNFRHDRSGKQSRTRRYQACSSLLCGLQAAGASTATLTRHRGADGIRMKDADKKLVEYGNVPFAKEAGDRLRVINDMLESHWADLALTDKQLATELEQVSGTQDNEAALPFDFTARTVYRVFNNNDWKRGGRFYGAWWISCPSRLRPHILIDGKRTVEVDYSGLHAAILFSLENRIIPSDPYERCLTKVGNKKERTLVKRTFNALLNADSIYGIKVIEGYENQITGRCWNDFKLWIVSCYPEFMKYFGTGIGLRLQRKDSDLAETVMLKFANMGYACLPVHDSFIVHHALHDELKDTMQSAFEKEFGAYGKVDLEIGRGEAFEVSDAPIYMIQEEDIKPKGHQARLQEFWSRKPTAVG